jgi:hypothetical protein
MSGEFDFRRGKDYNRHDTNLETQFIIKMFRLCSNHKVWPQEKLSCSSLRFP